MALTIDFAGPFVFGVRGFRVSPGHFAERFSLIVIIALGESIVAIGAGLPSDLDTGLVVAAVVGSASRARSGGRTSTWSRWCRSGASGNGGYERLRIARDSYSYLHLLMIAGIVLIALGIKKTIGHVDEPLKIVPAVALLGASRSTTAGTSAGCASWAPSTASA